MGKSVNTAYLMAGEKIEEDQTGTVVKAERTYRVLTSFAASAATAMAATSLPANNAQHPVYPKLRVRSRSPVLQENGIEWHISIMYEPIPVSQGAGASYNLVRLEYGTHALQEDVLFNLGNQKPILDANGMPFESTIQEAVEYPYIKIVKLQKTVSRDTVITVSGTINDNAVVVAGVSIAKHAGRIKIVATENPENEYPWEITYEVMVRSHTISNYIDFANVKQAGPTNVGWDMGIINRGYYYYNPSSTGTAGMSRALEDILDGDGTVIEQRPTASPVPLDENGGLLTVGVNNPPILILVQTIREASWSTLGLNSL